MSAATLKKRKDVTSWEAWRQAGIPPALVDGVLRPFFSGVVLEQEMTTSLRFTDQMMRMFARGRSTVPAGRLQELPRQLADQLPTGSVRTDAPVASVDGDRVVLEDGSTVSAAAVVSGRRAARTVVRDLSGTSR